MLAQLTLWNIFLVCFFWVFCLLLKVVVFCTCWQQSNLKFFRHGEHLPGFGFCICLLRLPFFQFCYFLLTLLRMEGKKATPTRFSPVTSTNVGISSQNFLTFSFNPFFPKLMNLNQHHPAKKVVFWSNPYQIEVMITSLIEVLEVPNFGHITIFTI